MLCNSVTVYKDARFCSLDRVIIRDTGCQTREEQLGLAFCLTEWHHFVHDGYYFSCQTSRGDPNKLRQGGTPKSRLWTSAAQRFSVQGFKFFFPAVRSITTYIHYNAFDKAPISTLINRATRIAGKPCSNWYDILMHPKPTWVTFLQVSRFRSRGVGTGTLGRRRQRI